MNDSTMVMKFELLPNEIFIECFEYLNGLEIYYSFDELNFRFNQLIRSIPLHLNLQHVRKSIFDQFCTNVLSNSKIKNQIISLKLSNEDTCDQIDRFLSLFSFDEFSNLRSLTLDRVTYDNEKKIQPMLLLTPNLCSFRAIDYEDKIPTILLSSKLQTLSLPNLSPYLNDDYLFYSIINLTISKCSLKELYQLFSCTPMLKYLHIHNIDLLLGLYNSMNNTTDSDRHCAIRLQKLTINNLQERFEHFKIFVKQIPNLKILTIFSEDESMINAYGWHDLITTSLHDLKTFNFKFTHLIKNNANIIIDKFKQFQNSFWQDQHHWNTEYVLDKDSAYIYTIPYISNTYILTPYTNRYSYELINDFNKLKTVTNLILYQKIMKNKSEFYFSNVESLILEDGLKSPEFSEDWYLRKEHVPSLEMIINLNNLKHLNISSKCKTGMLPLLLAILKQSSQLSSLTIVPYVLPWLFTNDELSGYLNKMIKKLDIYQKRDETLNEPHIITKFCKVFSNLEQLKCNIRKWQCLLSLLEKLPKLSFLNVIVTSNNKHLINQFDDGLSNMDISYQIPDDSSDQKVPETKIYIWNS